MDQYAMYGGAGMGLSQVPAVPSYAAGSVLSVSQPPVHSGASGTSVNQSMAGSSPTVVQQAQPGK